MNITKSLTVTTYSQRIWYKPMKTLCLPLLSLSPYVPDFVDSALFAWHHQSSLTSIIFMLPSLSHTCPLRRILLTPRGVSQWRLAISTFSPQKCLSVSLYINSYLLPEEASLMKTGQGTSIWAWQNITRNHFIDSFFPFDSYVWFYSRSQHSPVYGSWPSKQCRAWTPSHGMGLKLTQALVVNSHKFFTMIVLIHLADRTDGWSKILWLCWCPRFSFGSLQSTFMHQRY